VTKGRNIVGSLKGHDDDVYSLSWSTVPGENFRPSNAADDITDLETFGVGK